MKCEKHRKDFLSNCFWCGKKVCDLCILKSDRKKVYCEQCAPRVHNLGHSQLPIENRALPSKGRRFILENNHLILKGEE